MKDKTIVVTVEELADNVLKAASPDLPGFSVYSLDSEPDFLSKLPDIIESYIRIKSKRQSKQRPMSLHLSQLQYVVSA